MNSNKSWDIFAQPLCEYSMIDMKMPEIAGWKMSSKKYLYLIDHVKSEWDQFSIISRVPSRDMYFKKQNNQGSKLDWFWIQAGSKQMN